MTCDSLVSTELVTADGQIVTASETQNPDLFWAVRGAGGGNFGVHTSFTYRTVPAGTVTVFKYSWAGGEAASLIDSVLHAQVAAPRELGLRINIAPQLRMPVSQPVPLVIDVMGLFWGTPADLEGLLAPVERIQSADSKTVAAMPFPSARDFLSATTPIGTYAIKSGFVRGALPSDGVETVVDWVRQIPGVPSRVQDSASVLYCWGGKVNDVDPGATAFVHRNADFLFKGEVVWEPEDAPDRIAANLEWLDGYLKAMQPYLSGGAYQNFPDRTESDWQQAYYGENIGRLTEVKRTWDPTNLFRFPQSIPLHA